MTERPRTVIDIHTHLFNARYVPIQEILESRGVPRKLGVSAKLSRLILLLTGKTRFDDVHAAAAAARDLAKPEDALVQGIADLALEELTVVAEASIAGARTHSRASETEASDDAIDRLRESELYRLLVEIDEQYGEEDRTAAGSASDLVSVLELPRLDEKEPRAELESLFRGLRRSIVRFIRAALELVENAGDLLEFVWTMMLREEQILDRLLKSYNRDPGVDLIVHHMMDIAHPFAGETELGYYPEQLRRMTEVERISKGVAVGFTAFDPIRCVDEGSDDEEIRRLLDLGLASGKLGLKFYPPMDYRAADNANRRLEHVVDVFLDYSLERSVPVLAHCSPGGFEVHKGSGANSHPKYWRAALEKEGRSELRLCLGHAGGGRTLERASKDEPARGYGWLARTDEEWGDEDNFARHAVDLCTDYPNVYIDFSYIHEACAGEEREIFTRRLIAEVTRTAAECAAGTLDHALEDKIMFGSDWHMPSMVNDNDDYFEMLCEVFTTEGLAHVSERFFWRNALRFLELERFSERVRETHGEEYAERLRRTAALGRATEGGESAKAEPSAAADRSLGLSGVPV